jgi:hypothetical protein
MRGWPPFITSHKGGGPLGVVTEVVQRTYGSSVITSSVNWNGVNIEVNRDER